VTQDHSVRIRSYQKTCWNLKAESDKPWKVKTISVLPGFSLSATGAYFLQKRLKEERYF